MAQEIQKITREQVASFLDTTPTASEETWGLIGIGITSYGIAYNPQVTTEKWIIHKAATSSLDSYQRQGDVSQKCYKGDPIFEYVNELRRTCGIGAEVQSSVLDVDMWDKTGNAYKATKSDVIVVITNYMAEDAVIEYTIYYNGDPEQGTVTVANDGTPTFIPTVSL